MMNTFYASNVPRGRKNNNPYRLMSFDNGIRDVIKALALTVGTVCGSSSWAVYSFVFCSAWEASQLQTGLCCSWRLQKKLQWVTYLGWLRKQRWRRGDAALLQPICAHSGARGEDGILCHWSAKVMLTRADSTLWGTETRGGNRTRHVYWRQDSKKKKKKAIMSKSCI